MKADPREAILQQHIKMAESSLKDHEVLRLSHVADGFGIVVVGKPNSSAYRCNLVLTPGYLTLTGDIDTVCWGIYSGKTVTGAIEWMGHRSSPMDSYFNEKLRIGMGGVDFKDYEEDIAKHDLQERIKDCDEAGMIQHASAYKRILHMVETHTDDDVFRLEDYEVQHRVEVECYQVDWELGRVGMVPGGRVMWAWSILRKARELLGTDK